MKKLQILIAIFVTILIAGCFDFNSSKTEQDKNAQSKKPQMPIATVDVIVAKKTDNKMIFQYPAKLESLQEVMITPKVSGTIIKQNFKAGDKVKQGDVLFVIEPDKFEALYDIANAAIIQAESAYKNAKNEMERVEKLLSQKAISQKEYDNALAKFEAASASIASAKANAKSAKLDLSYTKIKAPFSGVVSENLVDVGSFVVAGNTQLVKLSDIDTINARFYISDVANLKRINNLTNKNWVQLDSNATLITNNGNIKGSLSFIDNTVDENTGSVLAKAEFKNENLQLLAGSFAKISLDGFIQKDSFLLPQIAIKQDVVSPYVLVAKDNKVIKKPIQIIFETSENAIINSGLEEGDQIIINNFNKIRIGANVKVENKENK
ncbi:efflux RND transporter periplasmic adaptor subunit [Campylobacter pinnipediorum]|uniref:Efflux transporter periplasmic adaptor subunit n=1 Tax=Campylobacter pinnipediorum subsp. pinnipediorum TaxID=1660067 RepID=A0AAX0LCR4_9BACT|nr:efflux RND transporter periplasmic adaptor subunit [Campylobacter pinnipediorum]AQW85249.1 multidrug efflux system CmeABC, periplasmic fusion protein CmeA [Campylobacter pinnipediorum subsp. pinnipediorum]OPA82128.1 efflux transporter periplasmic adaptor subunit [Campylobacter pinnipediorum subsp. pinnipediorum]